MSRLLIFGFLALGVLVGCGGDDDEATTPSDSIAPTEEQDDADSVEADAESEDDSEDVEEADASIAADSAPFEDVNVDGLVESNEVADGAPTGDITPVDEILSPEDALTSCEDAIAFVEALAEQYDTVSDVPTAELGPFSQLPTMIATCSLEQIDVFDSPEVAAFFGG